MGESRSFADWERRAKQVKAQNGGIFPIFWEEDIEKILFNEVKKLWS